MAKHTSGMTKFDAVKAALADMGPDAKPLAIQAYVKKHFNIDISTVVVSAYKKELRARGQLPARKPDPQTQAKPATPPTKPATPATPRAEPVTPAAKNGISIEDLQAVKALIGRVGPEGLKTLIDLMS